MYALNQNSIRRVCFQFRPHVNLDAPPTTVRSLPITATEILVQLNYGLKHTSLYLVSAVIPYVGTFGKCLFVANPAKLIMAISSPNTTRKVRGIPRARPAHNSDESTNADNRQNSGDDSLIEGVNDNSFMKTLRRGGRCRLLRWRSNVVQRCKTYLMDITETRMSRYSKSICGC